jgi:hypothetical protein
MTMKILTQQKFKKKILDNLNPARVIEFNKMAKKKFKAEQKRNKKILKNL